MSAVTNALNTETILEGLNEVFYDNFNEETIPQFAKLEDIFMVETSRKAQEFDLEMKGIGYFKTKGEEEDIYEDMIKEKYKTTYTNVTFADSVGISKEYFDDELYNVMKDMVGQLGEAARSTQYNQCYSIFRNAFSTSFLGGDGKALIADDHPLDFGGVLDNKLTDKLSPKSLQAAIKMMAEQKDHSGRLRMLMPSILLVPPHLFPLAVEITEAEYIPKSANNEPNYVSSKYNVIVKQSPYIGTVMGGSDDAWFLLAKKHKIKRFIRESINTWMNDWKEDRKNITYYSARYRESCGWSSPVGIVGSDGSTGSY